MTPLWLAAVSGQLEIVKILIQNGANINSVSNSGSTPVRSACFMSHLEIVKLLVENKADIQMTSNFGGTCLINSVQSAELCKFLLEKGASVNNQDAGNQGATDIIISMVIGRYIGIGRFIGIADMRNAYRYQLLVSADKKAHIGSLTNAVKFFKISKRNRAKSENIEIYESISSPNFFFIS